MSYSGNPFEQKKETLMEGSKLTSGDCRKIAQYVLDEYRARSQDVLAAFRMRLRDTRGNVELSLEMAIAVFGSALVGGFGLDQQNEKTREIFAILAAANVIEPETELPPLTDEQIAAQSLPLKALPLCELPPEGWYCTRGKGHEGPCAALPKSDLGGA